jgi:poly-gamma-glutamate synthesis protein (capsule biosynthesis protein)
MAKRVLLIFMFLIILCNIWPAEAPAVLLASDGIEADAPPLKAHVRLAFTGDLMVHENQLKHAYHPETGTYMFECFNEIAAYLQDADYTIGNLETTLAGRDAGYATYPLFNTPDSFAVAVKEAGFDFLSTANNHCFDKREAGLLRTLDVLDSLGFAHTGTFASWADADNIVFQEINDIKIAFLSYSYSTNGIPVPLDKPYLVNILDESRMRTQIILARVLGADAVIVLPHMGVEYAGEPNAALKTLARKLCDWGADAVMASHPHVLQPTEVYSTQQPYGRQRTCFIAYSMGNFISSQRTEPRDAGAVFYLELEKTYDQGQSWTKIKSVSAAPTWVQFLNTVGAYDIKVLPVHDTLRAVERGEITLRPQDIKRLQAVHRETTLKLLGTALSDELMQPSYTLFNVMD